MMLMIDSKARPNDGEWASRHASAPRGNGQRVASSIEWLPWRERQIAQIVSARGEASAADICEALGGEISNAAVRSMLRRLELKGVLLRRKQGRKYLYILTRSAPDAGLHALKDLIDSHFNRSPMEAALTVLGMLQPRSPAQAKAVAELSTLLKQVELD